MFLPHMRGGGARGECAIPIYTSALLPPRRPATTTVCLHALFYLGGGMRTPQKYESTTEGKLFPTGDHHQLKQRQKQKQQQQHKSNATATFTPEGMG